MVPRAGCPGSILPFPKSLVHYLLSHDLPHLHAPLPLQFMSPPSTYISAWTQSSTTPEHTLSVSGVACSLPSLSGATVACTPALCKPAQGEHSNAPPRMMKAIDQASGTNNRVSLWLWSVATNPNPSNLGVQHQGRDKTVGASLGPCVFATRVPGQKGLLPASGLGMGVLTSTMQGEFEEQLDLLGIQEQDKMEVGREAAVAAVR